MRCARTGEDRCLVDATRLGVASVALPQAKVLVVPAGTIEGATAALGQAASARGQLDLSFLDADIAEAEATLVLVRNGSMTAQLDAMIAGVTGYDLSGFDALIMSMKSIIPPHPPSQLQ